jgi:hypothetical protein
MLEQPTVPLTIGCANYFFAIVVPSASLMPQCRGVAPDAQPANFLVAAALMAEFAEHPPCRGGRP